MQAAAGSRPAGLRVVLHRDGSEGHKPRFHLAGTTRDVQVQLDAPDLGAHAVASEICLAHSAAW
eukprot:3109826-Prymnesium_polylepis.1